MKIKLLLSLVIVCLAFCSCNDDDTINVGNEYKDKLEQMYPGVQHVQWEKEQGYIVADFWRTDIGTEAEAWFNRQVEWEMTVTEILYGAFPQEVKVGFEAGEYGDWYIEDTDMVERNGKGTIYVIEVEKGKKEYDLYFNAEGILLKAMPDTDRDTTPSHYISMDI